MSDNVEFEDIQWKEHQMACALFDEAVSTGNLETAEAAFERLSKFVDTLSQTFELLCEMYGKKNPIPQKSDTGAIERVATLAIQFAQNVVDKMEGRSKE